MRTFVINKSSTTAPRKQEIRNTTDRLLNEKPRQEMMCLDIPHLPSASMYSVTAMDVYERASLSRHVFESCRFVTMIWIEDYREGDTSFGYYHRITSYFHLPQGMEMEELVSIRMGEDIYARLNVEPYRRTEDYHYQRRVADLEEEIAHLRRSAVILPQERIDAIHNGARDCMDKPVPMQYFDEKIFELE